MVERKFTFPSDTGPQRAVNETKGRVGKRLHGALRAFRPLVNSAAGAQGKAAHHRIGPVCGFPMRQRAAGCLHPGGELQR